MTEQDLKDLHEAVLGVCNGVTPYCSVTSGLVDGLAIVTVHLGRVPPAGVHACHAAAAGICNAFDRGLISLQVVRYTP